MAEQKQRKATGAPAKRASAKKREAKKKKKVVIFAIELIIILVMLAVLYLVMNKTNEGPKVTYLEPDKLEIHEEVHECGIVWCGCSDRESAV